MAKSYLDQNGLAYFWTYLKTFFVPSTRTINNKPLSSDVILTAKDVNAITDPQIKQDGQILCYDGENQAWKAIDFEQGGIQTIDEGTVNGTIKVNGVRNVFVHGLKSAAYKEANEFRSSQWLPKPEEIGAVAEPNNLSDGDVAVYEDGEWTAAAPIIKPNVVEGGQILRYDSGEGEWVADDEITVEASDVPGSISVNHQPLFVNGLESAAFMDASAFVSTTSVGSASGVCPLDAASKVDPTFLPSYVDDVVECYIVGNVPLANNWLSETVGGEPLIPEDGKIYIILTAGDYENFQYRWGGSTYVKINDSGVSSMTNAEIDEILNS